MHFTTVLLAAVLALQPGNTNAHPHQLVPVKRKAPSVPILMYRYRDQPSPPDSSTFKAMRRSQHSPEATKGAHPIPEVPEVNDEERIRARLVEHPKLDIVTSHAFDVIQHAPLPNGFPRGFLEAKASVETNEDRKARTRRELVARMEELAQSLAEAFKANESEDAANANYRYPAYSERPPTKEGAPLARNNDTMQKRTGSNGSHGMGVSPFDSVSAIAAVVAGAIPISKENVARRAVLDRIQDQVDRSDDIPVY